MQHGRRLLAVHPHMRGENRSDAAYSFAASVHPHMRGENLGLRLPDFLEIGSPPHAWGKSINLLLTIRFIGSPPHAWGKCRTSYNRQSTSRFTPTCVGKIGRRPLCWMNIPVHPHMRGENGGNANTCFYRVGSPPHAWGKFLNDKMPSEYVGSPPHAWGKLGRIDPG